MSANHGEYRYRKLGCRCAVCCEWRDKANARDRKRRAIAGSRVLNPSHGTERRYLTGCRCAPCAAAYDRKKARNRASIARAGTARRAAALTYARTYRQTHREKMREYGRRWRAANPEKVRAYAAAWREANPRPTSAPLSSAWPFTRNADHLDPLTAAINAAIPRALPADIREEVAQDLAVDLLTSGGPITSEAIAAAVRAYWRRYPVMAGREVSLDAAIPGRDNERERRSDQIAHPASLAAIAEERAARYAGSRR